MVKVVPWDISETFQDKVIKEKEQIVDIIVVASSQGLFNQAASLCLLGKPGRAVQGVSFVWTRTFDG